jgi:hypothetical protein
VDDISLGLVAGTVTIIDPDGGHHPTGHPELFDTAGGSIAHIDNQTDLIHDIYGDTLAAAAEDAHERWGIELPADPDVYTIWHLAALTC